MDDDLNVLLTFYWLPYRTLQRVALRVPHGLDEYSTDVEFFREPQHQDRIMAQLSVYYRDKHATGELVLVNAEKLDEIQIGDEHGQ